MPCPMGDNTPVPLRGRLSKAADLSWIHFSIHQRLRSGWLHGASLQKNKTLLIGHVWRDRRAGVWLDRREVRFTGRI